MALGKSPAEIVESGAFPLLAIAPHWERIPLGDVATVQNGAAFGSEFFTHGDGMPLIRIRDVRRDFTENHYNGPFEEEFLVRKGDLLIGMDGDFHAAIWKGPNGLLNQRVCRLIQKTELYSRDFLFIVLQPYLNAINAETSSVTVKHLSSRSIAEIPLPLPPLAEQKRIVSKIEELFSELEAGEESLRRARRQLGVYRQSLLKQAFEGKLTAPWRKQNPHLLESPDQILARIEAERHARYQQQLKEREKAGGGKGKPKKPENICLLSDLTLASPPDLPHGWAWLKVADIGRIETGTTPPTNDPANYGGDTPFFKPTDLEQGANVREAREHLSAKGRHAARILSAGTTLVTCIGATIGKTGLASVECATNQQINTISPEACLEPRFVYYAAIAPSLNGLVKSEASATTLPILNKSKFEALPFPVCSLPEQREIVRLLDEQFTVIEQNEREIDAALKRSAALRQSILKKAFTGQLVPQDATDEPASVLLERIRKEREGSDKKRSITKKNSP